MDVQIVTSCANRKFEPQRALPRQLRSWCIVLMGLLAGICFSPGLQGGESGQIAWELRALESLCTKYLGKSAAEEEAGLAAPLWLDRLARRIGRRLAGQGLGAVPAEDLAMVALLQARLNRSNRDAAIDAKAAMEPAVARGPGLKQSIRDVGDAAGHLDSRRTNGRTAASSRLRAAVEQESAEEPASSQPSSTQEDNLQKQPDQKGDPGSDTDRSTRGGKQQPPFSDIAKGDEGFRQGVEQLAELPITERLVMTGDITSGFQAATVPNSPELTSAFGRARMNFVLQAMPASPGGRLSEGYFFMQMRAAGGPFDTAAVGGPNLFSSLNDVATDRSRFNEGTSRGNLYLAKAFYQQSLKLGEGEVRGRAGIINFTDYFDTNLFANNEARQFVNSAFVNSAAFKTGISAPGMMAEYERDPWLFNPPWLNGIVLRAGYAVSRTERAFTSPLWTSELELQTTIKNLQGHWRFGGSFGNFAGVGGIGEFHISVDQWLSPNLGVFGRWGFSNSGPGSQAFGPVRQAYSFGVQRRFIDAEERVSAWAIGFSQAFPIEEAEGDPLASERVLETYYRWQVTRNVSLTPHFQFILGSGGLSSRGTHTVYGARLFFAY